MDHVLIVQGCDDERFPRPRRDAGHVAAVPANRTASRGTSLLDHVPEMRRRAIRSVRRPGNRTNNRQRRPGPPRNLRMRPTLRQERLNRYPQIPVNVRQPHRWQRRRPRRVQTPQTALANQLIAPRRTPIVIHRGSLPLPARVNAHTRTRSDARTSTNYRPDRFVTCQPHQFPPVQNAKFQARNPG